jgi:hypothetical protein
VLGVLDRLHGTCTGFNIALKLGHGTTLGVSRREVAAAVQRAKGGDGGAAKGSSLFEDRTD